MTRLTKPASATAAPQKNPQAAPAQLPVFFRANGIPSAYANVFQTRFTDSEIVLSYGMSLTESAPDQNGEPNPVLAVDMERRIVMTPEVAMQLVAALNQTVQQFAASKQSAS